MWGVVFPGQGSQVPGMGQFLVDNFQVAKERFEEASDTLGLNFKKLCFEGSESDLALTENTQPALVLVSTATWQSLGTMVDLPVKAFAGHSVGEYSALVAAGGMSFSDAIRAVRRRGEAMQSAVPVGEGGMLAIVGPESAQMKDLCEWAVSESGQGPLSPANFNAPTQTVVSGSAGAVNWLAENIKSFNFEPAPRLLKAVPLKVSAPFHCEMMKPAEETMGLLLGDMEFSDVSTPVVQNFTAEAVTSGSDLRTNLVSQVCGSVRWVECMQKMAGLGVEKIFESGTGKVLAGLQKKIEKSVSVFGANSLDDLKAIESAIA